MAGESNHLVHALEEVDNARTQASIRLGSPVILHADMDIGEVQHSDHGVRPQSLG